jgi:hypothetical protein
MDKAGAPLGRESRILAGSSPAAACSTLNITMIEILIVSVFIRHQYYFYTPYLILF